MKCRRFYIEKDYDMIVGWYGLRNMSKPPMRKFPIVGYMVDDVGAGFLYQTDSDICFLDGYITNPGSTKEARREAIDIITESLLFTAEDRGFFTVMAYTKNPNIEKYCEDYDFEKKITHTLFVKEINNGLYI